MSSSTAISVPNPPNWSNDFHPYGWCSLYSSESLPAHPMCNMISVSVSNIKIGNPDDQQVFLFRVIQQWDVDKLSEEKRMHTFHLSSYPMMKGKYKIDKFFIPFSPKIEEFVRDTNRNNHTLSVDAKIQIIEGGTLSNNGKVIHRGKVVWEKDIKLDIKRESPSSLPISSTLPTPSPTLVTLLSSLAPLAPLAPLPKVDNKANDTKIIVPNNKRKKPNDEAIDLTNNINILLKHMETEPSETIATTLAEAETDLKAIGDTLKAHDEKVAQEKTKLLHDSQIFKGQAQQSLEKLRGTITTIGGKTPVEIIDEMKRDLVKRQHELKTLKERLATLQNNDKM